MQPIRSVATVTGLSKECSSDIVFFSSQCPDQLWAHPAACRKAAGFLSPTVKRPELELDQLPFSTEVKNE
jgi:hypothetical protein